MLNRLVESQEQVAIQQTRFSHDVIGRYVCNTWDEAVNNGGSPFDVVVLGSGMYGAYCAEKVYRQGEQAGLRVLVLEAGTFLVSEHVQNLARLGLDPAGPVTADPGVPRNVVWGLPWRSQTTFPGLAYCIGGRSLFWGGWSPRLTDADLAEWPPELQTYLQTAYPSVQREIGTSPTTDFISGDLFVAVKGALEAAAPHVPTVDAIEDAPLAVQGAAPASGLFSFDKYSSAPIMCDAIREAAAQPDSSRRLFLVPRAHVLRLVTSAGLVTSIELDVEGSLRVLPLAPTASVLIALGTIESTRLALQSFPTPLIGKNLMAHLRSNTIFRVPRTALGAGLPIRLEAAAALVRGSTPQGRYHLQVTAAALDGTNPEAVMFRMIPDIDLLDHTLASQQSEWIVITLRGIGEMRPARNGASNWIDLSPYERDEFGMSRAWVSLKTTPDADQLWNAMDGAALGIAARIANGGPVQFLKAGSWTPTPYVQRDSLGTTHHESGTLFMGSGTDPSTSVTDTDGRFKHVGNVFAVGPSTFPQMGSANPSLTAFALARRTASAVVRDAMPVVEPGFKPLFAGSLEGWLMSGRGQFNVLGKVLQSEGGIGLLWYAPEEFQDFVLRVDWRASSPDDNSGVFLRFPTLGQSDPDNDWKLAVNKGYEVQIDDRGFDPATNATGEPSHLTGAIYALAPVEKLLSRPVGQWNTFEIHAVGNKIDVLLNGEHATSYVADGSRPLRGHIGLQAHHPGSRVVFRNVRVQPL